jgi:spore germination protein KC
MHKSKFLAVLLAIVITLSGCTQIARGRAEIDKLFIVRVFSIDEAQGGKVKVTLTTKNLSTDGGGQQQMQMGESIVSEGDTVFDAVRNLLVYSDKRPNYGHTEYILFGEDIAKKGILPYLDFISRDNEFRYNAKIYIVKGDKADSVVKNANTTKIFIGDRIASIEENMIKISLFSIVTLNEALLIFDNKNLDTFIPYIELTNTMTSESQQQNIYDVLLSGYAMFKMDKLLYFTPREEARGINWIMNRVESGVIVVKNKSGQEISMEIIDSKSKIIPRIEGSELYCTIDLSFDTNIAEVMGEENITDYNTIRYLVEQQEKVIKHEVENAIKIAQKNNSDHFSTITKFIIKYPMMRNYLKDNWKDIFPNIKFDVKVESKIKGTYLINEPARASGEAQGE